MYMQTDILYNDILGDFTIKETAYVSSTACAHMYISGGLCTSATLGK